jgi:hypothetical protein
VHRVVKVSKYCLCLSRHLSCLYPGEYWPWGSFARGQSNMAAIGSLLKLRRNWSVPSLFGNWNSRAATHSRQYSTNNAFRPTRRYAEPVIWLQCQHRGYMPKEVESEPNSVLTTHVIRTAMKDDRTTGKTSVVRVWKVALASPDHKLAPPSSQLRLYRSSSDTRSWVPVCISNIHMKHPMGV